MDVKKWADRSADALILVDAKSGDVIHMNQRARWMMYTYFDQRKPEKNLPKALQTYLEELQVDGDGAQTRKMGKLQLSYFSFPQHKDKIVLHLQSLDLGNIRNSSIIYENNVAGIYEVSLEGDWIHFNDAFARILCYTPEELRQKKGTSFYVNPNDRVRFLESLREKGSLEKYETRYLRKDGSIAWCLENAFLIEDETSIIGTVVDITEQKRLKDQYESLFLTSTDAILVLRDGSVVRANNRCREILGYDQDELQAMDVFSKDQGLFQLNDQQKSYLESKFERISEGETGKAQLIARRKDNSSFFCEISFTAVKVLGIDNLQMVIRDVSERVFYEEALKSSESRFRLLSEVAIEGVVFVLDHQIRDCNPQFAELFGYKSREDLMGRRITDFINEQELSRLEQTLSIRSLNRTEIRTSTKEGMLLVLEATGSKIEHRNKDYNVFLFYDITSRKRAEQKLEQSTERFKSVVEYSPNGIFILTDGRIKYANSSGLELLGFEEEDDIFGDEFVDFFDREDREEIEQLLDNIRDGERIEVREFQFENDHGDTLTVGLKATLSVYDNQPSIQVTLNNLTTRMKLMQETLRAQLAEEINVVLKREIEQHKITQQKLHEAENFTRNIIESSIDMIIAVDDNDRVTEFNPAAKRQFGYSSSDIIGQKAKILYADPEVYKTVRKKIQKGKYYSGEIENVTSTGKRFTSFLSANVIRDDEGNIIGSMGVSRDVTELKKAEMELRESEERYRDLFENASDLIFAIDAKGKFQYANQSFIKTLGYSFEQLKETNFCQVVTERTIAESENLLEDFANIPLELEFISKDGQIIQAYGGSSIRTKKGEADSIRAIYRDITDLRRQEHVALEQAARLESIFNSTENMMMWTLNLDGNIGSYNHNFETWLRTDLSLEVDTTCDFISLLREKVNPNAYQSQLDRMKKAYKGKAQQFELPLINAQGHEIWVQIFLSPVKVQETLEEISCIAYDITDRKEMDRKILDSLKEKEVLLQEVHHRVKNNLQVISSILNLQSSFVDDKRTLELLEESQRRIKTMSYIHESLYQNADFSSIEFTDYISTLTRNLILSYSTLECDVKLDLDFDKIYLNLDQAIPCGLIINELVSNALKYAFAGRDEGKLCIRIQENEGKVSMLVEDDGVGLPEGFKYEESESLGFYLVYALVEQLDADINVSSNLGTRFLITFEKQ